MLGASGNRRTVEPTRRTDHVTFVFMLAGIVLITVVALLAVGRLGELPDTTPDRAPLALPEDRPMAKADVDDVRFATGLRGYRMDQVDETIDRVADELARRDAEVERLQALLLDLRTAVPEPDDVYRPQPGTDS